MALFACHIAVFHGRLREVRWYPQPYPSCHRWEIHRQIHRTSPALPWDGFAGECLRAVLYFVTVRIGREPFRWSMRKIWSLCMAAPMLKKCSRRVVSWPPDMVADKFAEYGDLTWSPKSFCARTWPPDILATRCFPFFSQCRLASVSISGVCVSARRHTFSERPTGTHGHRETRRPQIHTETRRPFFEDSETRRPFFDRAKA